MWTLLITFHMQKTISQFSHLNCIHIFYKLIITFLLCTGTTSFFQPTADSNNDMLVYVMNPNTEHLQLYWKNDNNEPLLNFKNLKSFVESKQERLVFAMNGGMYMTDNSPLGLFIENGKTITILNRSKGKGNFYLAPNGVFFINRKNVAGICPSSDFKKKKDVAFATQSGPLLLWNGHIHPAFVKGSVNLNIRNGVGILPDNKIVFVMSKQQVNFYDFAMYFKSLGCKEALYLDGFVSRTYLPEQNWIQTDGNFGVMIGVTKPAKH